MKNYKTYSTYKDSGIEWIGKIPEHWEALPFHSIFRLKKESGYINEELLSVYLNQGVIRFSDVDEKRTNVTSLDLSKYQLVEKGDFVLNNQQAWRGSVGVSEYRGIISPAYIVLQQKKDSNSPIFLNYLLRNKSSVGIYVTCSKGVGTIQRNLYWHELKNQYLFLPPLSEQEAIANFLDDKTSKIDQAITQKEALIDLLKERKQIIIQDLVTGKKVWNEEKQVWEKPTKVKDSGIEWIGEIPEDWEVKRLKYVCNINLHSLPENTSGEYKFNYVDIGSVSFENGIEKTEPFKFKNSPSRARRIAKKGNAIISTVRTYLKAIDYITEKKSNYIYSTGFAILDATNINDTFLFHFVRSNAFTEQVTIDSKGMSYPAINSTDLSRLLVAIPSFNEQNQIVSHIESESSKIDHAISIMEEEIEHLKELKAVLIDSAVTGKIRVS